MASHSDVLSRLFSTFAGVSSSSRPCRRSRSSKNAPSAGREVSYTNDSGRAASVKHQLKPTRRAHQIRWISSGIGLSRPRMMVWNESDQVRGHPTASMCMSIPRLGHCNHLHFSRALYRPSAILFNLSSWASISRTLNQNAVPPTAAMTAILP